MADIDNIDQVLQEHDAELAAVRERREKLINKLMPVVESLNFDSINEMRASDRESLMGVISTADSLLKSAEAAVQNKAKIALTKKQDDRNADHGAAVISLLQQFKANMCPNVKEVAQDMDRIDDAVEEAFNSSEIPLISEEELERTPMELA